MTAKKSRVLATPGEATEKTTPSPTTAVEKSQVSDAEAGLRRFGRLVILNVDPVAKRAVCRCDCCRTLRLRADRVRRKAAEAVASLDLDAPALVPAPAARLFEIAKILDALAELEAEAMPAGLMRRLLRERIEALLPPRALEVSKVAEASERDYLERLAEAVGKAR